LVDSLLLDEKETKFNGGVLEKPVLVDFWAVSTVSPCWISVARAHGVRFKNIDPTNTLVQAKLVGEGYKVEIEAEAVLD